MTFFEWFQKWNGQLVDTDGNKSYQCMDLMHRYILDVLGLDVSVLRAATALDAWNAGSAQFTRIKNAPWNVPKQGDIVFFGSPYGKYIGTDKKIHYAGHVCIFNEGNVLRFTSVDQNDPLGSRVHVQSHSYLSCLGWLRKK